jgi:DnaA family protein
MQQLPLSIALRDDATFANYLELPGNSLALRALLQLDADADYSLHYLRGAAGTGRSHLLQAACHSQPESIYLPMTELAACEPAAVFAELELQRLVCVDDVDAVAGQGPWEEALFHFLNRKMLCGGVVLMTAARGPQEVFLLPDLVSRLRQGLVLRLLPSDDEDKARLFVWRARLRGMHIADDVAAFVLRHYSRNLDQLLRLLDQLDAQSLEKKRRLTIPFVREVLAGQDNATR